MNRDEILKQVFDDHEYKQVSFKLDRNGDLYSEFCLYMCEMPEDKLLYLIEKKYLKLHCMSIIWHSSRYRDQYVNFSKNTCGTNEIEHIQHDEYDHEIDARFKKLEIALKDENWYDKQLFLIATTGACINGQVVKYKSLLHLSRETGIPYKSILISYKNIQQRVSKKI